MKSSICEKICPYYKPAKDESLACLGYLILEKLISKGVPIVCEKKNRALHHDDSERLLKYMCIKCPFYDDDCDFALVSRSNSASGLVPSALPHSREGELSENDRNPSPCGGFILLGYLLGENIIGIDDIRNLI